MKPIPGETVLSILRGPADAGHIREMSQFLRRQINVWGKERSMLFGRCHHRQPHVILAHSRAERGDAAAGHFTLSGGSEPRNAEAGRRPNDCAFDCVSDQTGYPAAILRQIVAQRMLVKLYHGRLRGRDYQFQCSRCSVSGGDRLFTRNDAIALIKFSKENKGHAHLHWYNKKCKECKKGTNKICCMVGYVKIIKNGVLRDPKSLFANENSLLANLVKIMNTEQGKNAKSCLEDTQLTICNEVKFDNKGRPVVDMFLDEPLLAYELFYKTPEAKYQPFLARWIIMILLASNDRKQSVVDILTIYPSKKRASLEINPPSSPNPGNQIIQLQNQGNRHDSKSQSAPEGQPIQVQNQVNQGNRHNSQKFVKKKKYKGKIKFPYCQRNNQAQKRKSKGTNTNPKPKLQKQGNQGEKENPENKQSSQNQGNQGEKENPENQQSSPNQGNQGEKENPENQQSSPNQDEQIRRKIKKMNQKLKKQQQNQQICEEPISPPQPALPMRLLLTMWQFGETVVTRCYGPPP